MEMLSPQHLFLEYLSRNKMAATEQRRIILEVFLEMVGHYSSEDLYMKVRERDPTISSATVYRTIKLLVESKIAEPIDFGDGVVRFECCGRKQHHDHLICSQCGKKVDVVDREIEKLQRAMGAKHGFSLKRHKMILFGICHDCRNR